MAKKISDMTDAELRLEVRRLRVMLSGYKTSNGNYKSAIASVREELKSSQQECLAQKKRADDMQETCRLNLASHEKEKIRLKNELHSTIMRRDEFEKEMNKYKEDYERILALPWYKRIFLKS